MSAPASAAVFAARWPDALWRADVLDRLDARARVEIQAAGALVVVEPGTSLFGPGDPADGVYVVARGRVEVSAVRRSDGARSRLREVREGELFGEDAIVRVASTRTTHAIATTRATVARVPAGVLLRALTRAKANLEGDAKWRIVRRAAVASAMGQVPFVAGLSERERGVLLDAAKPVTVARGQPVYRAGDAASEVYFVVDGVVSVGDEVAGKGAVLGAEDALGRRRRERDAIASGSAWLLSVPLDAFEAVVVRNRAAWERSARDGRADKGRDDSYRVRVARSLLVIDQDACVRCGNCVTGCASAHEDGVARLVRSGERVSLAFGPERAEVSLPHACQHCSEAACMEPCPTGAITRSSDGRVAIRESLCTGCGACERACPWDNIELAVKAGRVVAVKCDLCEGQGGGPACVAACPTAAAIRVDPERGAGERPVVLRPAFTLSVGAGSALAAMGVFVSLSQARVSTSGWALVGLVTLLAAYSAAKRGLRVRLRPHTLAHVALGVIACAVTLAHVRHVALAGLGGALFISMTLALATGLFGLVAYALLPRALARLESRAELPDEWAERARQADRRLLAALSGRSEGAKAVFSRVIDPYRRAPLGWASLALSGRTSAEEVARLTRAIEVMLGPAKNKGEGATTAKALESIIATGVELRALAARRVLERSLTSWLPVHVAFAVVASLLAVAHVVAEVIYR